MVFGGGKPAGPLVRGTRRPVTLTSTGRPVDWHANLRRSLASTFTVGSPEQYTVKVGGIPKTVGVPL